MLSVFLNKIIILNFANLINAVGLDFEILSSYTFIVVCLGTMILATVAGMVGTITVLKGQSLIGDAIGHSSYPGIIVAFMISMSLDSVSLMIGAIISGTLAFIIIQFMDANSKLNLDAILATILSAFFGLGMVLKSFIQGHPIYGKVPQGGLSNYIFGQAAFIRTIDVQLILAVAIPSLLILFLFYKEFKIFVFDEVYAKSIGLNSILMYVLLVLITMSVIATGLKLVGAILISSFLIVPGITALQWSNRFSHVLIIAAIVGSFSAFVGTYISSVYAGMSTGPCIIVVMSGLAFISMFISPKGLLANWLRRRKYLNDLSKSIID